ncbi:trafficking protein particle complex subunit 12-like [Impatiens glandulifera]|uniref:trafficking protein particle complex subunit 12-like n=1 Tax=Impatiens glandulifera TaxID=253017 RepID=UPI001FB0FFBE|nr:trafficking protein particle complex subunit 12-like [Impatiens glandulifera]
MDPLEIEPAFSLSTADDPLTSPFTTLNDLCYELSSLQDLASRGSWRSILDKVDRARKQSLLSKPHEHLTYLAYNSLSLVKLRRFADAAAEIDSMDDDLDSPLYRYESYVQNYPNRRGSMVPFVLRWIHAELPSKLGKQQETLDRFYKLLDFVRTNLNQKMSNEDDDGLNVSVNLWRRRENFVVNSIISHHLGRKEYGVCQKLINDMIRRNEEVKNNPNSSSNVVLLSKLGYIKMQYGDVEGAKATFDRIEKMIVMDDGKEKTEMKNLVSRNKALIYLVGKDYVSAVREYGECIERDGSDMVAINNKAICLMYLRELSGSIQVLEKALEIVPTVALNETVVVNLCSMYELAYVNHSDIKRTLSNWISKVAPDDFDSSSTRIV